MYKINLIFILLFPFSLMSQDYVWSESLNRFALKMQTELQKEKVGQSFVWSPFSLYMVLAMSGRGSNGKSYQEFQSLLGDIQKAQKIELPQDNAFLAANRIYLEKTYSIEASYQESMEKVFQSSIISADFLKKSEEERVSINAWVEELTQKRIINLLPAGLVNAGTALVLVNAVYLKAEWREQFKKERSEEGIFSGEFFKNKKVHYMRQQAEFLYASQSNYDFLELPYQGGILSFQVFLPRVGKNISDIEIDAILDPDTKIPFESRQIDLRLPRFKTSFSLSPEGTLQSLGLKRAFMPQEAEFTRISKKNDLFISAIVHKAEIEVDEEGTEAAAASAVVMARTSFREPKPVVDFFANRPFLYIIRDRIHNLILFMGVYKGDS